MSILIERGRWEIFCDTCPRDRRARIVADSPARLGLAAAQAQRDGWRIGTRDICPGCQGAPVKREAESPF